MSSKSDQQTKQFACKLEFEYSKLSDRLPKAVHLHCTTLNINICQKEQRESGRTRARKIKERQHQKQVLKL